MLDVSYVYGHRQSLLSSFPQYFFVPFESLQIRTQRSSATGNRGGSTANSSEEMRQYDTFKKLGRGLRRGCGWLISVGQKFS